MGSYSQKKYRSKSSRPSNFTIRFHRYSPHILTVLAAVLLLSSLMNNHLWDTPRKWVTDAVSPLIFVVGYPFHFISGTFGHLTDVTKIISDNAQLRSENKELQEWYQTALLLRSENQSLKDLLNVTPEPEMAFITARVIGDTGRGFVKTLIVEAGAEDGVEEGQAVLGGKGMIGRVIEVGARASRILLLTDINSHIPVIIEGANQRAILAGRNDNKLNLIHLPDDILVEKGAKIVTAASGGAFPAGLPIGEVYEIKGDMPMVHMFSDPYSADFVQLISKPLDPNIRNSIHSLTSENK